MPQGLNYGIGFMLATAVLHAVGIGIGFMIGMTAKIHDKAIYRTVGGLASVAGLALLVGYL